MPHQGPAGWRAGRGAFEGSMGGAWMGVPVAGFGASGTRRWPFRPLPANRRYCIRGECEVGPLVQHFLLAGRLSIW